MFQNYTNGNNNDRLAFQTDRKFHTLVERIKYNYDLHYFDQSYILDLVFCFSWLTLNIIFLQLRWIALCGYKGLQQVGWLSARRLLRGQPIPE